MSREKPLDPIPESVTGVNLPYRGGEQHGVPHTLDPTNFVGWDESDEKVEYETEETEPDPIPVRIVTGDSPRETEHWGGGVWYIGSLPVQIVNRMEFRTDLQITNEGPNTVFLAPDSTALGFNSPVKLEEGGTFTLNGNGAVWAICASGENASLRVFWEFTVKG